jgi:hypothetical protein
LCCTWVVDWNLWRIYLNSCNMGLYS